MAQTKSTLAEVLNEVAPDEGIVLSESTSKFPTAVKKVAIEGTSGNLIETLPLLDRTYLAVENSAASEYEVEVAAGENPPAVRKGLGTYAFKVPSKTIALIPLDSSRHINAKGQLVLTFSNASFAGNIALLTVKKGV